MNVVLFNTDDSRGGAARATLRLHQALSAANVHSRVLVRNKLGNDPSIIGLTPGTPSQVRAGELVQDFYINRRRTQVTNTLLSFGHPGISCSKNETVQQADVLNFHWVTNFLTSTQVSELLDLGKPIVWTLHDQGPMTGGCHYAAGCRQFTDICQICPQLTEDPARLIEAAFQDKYDAYGDQITVVSPSQWMGNEARASRIFRNSRIEVIPTGLDLQAFAPMSKSDAKRGLGIPEDAFVMLFACSAAEESRKGGGFLKAVLQKLSEDPTARSLHEAGKLWLLCFGWNTQLISSNYFNEKHLGFVGSDAELRSAYNAADVLLHFSTEDNLPNTVVEAMACGTPVLAANLGGVGDLIGENECGWLLEYGNVAAFSEQIVRLIDQPPDCQAAGARARTRIEERYTPTLQAGRYLKLFEELVSAPRPVRKTQRSTRVAGKFFELLEQAACNGIAELTQTKEKLVAENDSLRFSARELSLENDYIKKENSGLLSTVAQKDHELQSTSLQLDRAKKNIGYRVAHGVTKGLKQVEKAVRPGRKS